MSVAASHRPSSSIAWRRVIPPTRASVVIVPTRDTDTEVREILGRMHVAMMEQAESLTAEEARVVERFLRGMASALDAVGTERAASHAR